MRIYLLVVVSLKNFSVLVSPGAEVHCTPVTQSARWFEEASIPGLIKCVMRQNVGIGYPTPKNSRKDGYEQEEHGLTSVILTK